MEGAARRVPEGYWRSFGSADCAQDDSRAFASADSAQDDTLDTLIMRTLPINLDRELGILVQGVNAPNPVSQLACLQDERLQLVVHDLEPYKGELPVLAYSEKALLFTTMRASVGLVDEPPSSGTFKLRVDDQTTAALTWPADLSTPVLIAAWKTTVLNALKGLANVGADGIRAEDTAETPAHFFNFAWNDAEREDEIEVVENKLSPPTEATLTSAMPSQELKLALFPFRVSVDFESPTPPAATVIPTRTGATGTNAEQTLIVPLAATGSVSLAWSGSSTSTLAVGTLSGSALQAALNTIVPDGGTNPSFRVQERPPANGTRRFAVEFTGPLGGAAQAALVPSMHDQLARPYAVGVLDLRGNLPISRALNDTGVVELVFELTIDEEEKYQLPLLVTNSLTGPTTLEDLAQTPGAVVLVPTTIYVDGELGEPYVTAAPAVTFDLTVPAAGSSYTLSHNKETWLPSVRVHRRMSPAPSESWRELDPVEFGADAVTENAVTVVFPYLLLTDELDEDDEWQPLWRGNFRIQVESPNAALLVYGHEHTWDQVRQSLPAGTTLSAKIAALETALGIVGGSLRVLASHIDGTLSVTQIDVVSLATSLVSQATFATALTQLFANNADVITSIVNELGDSTTFATALTQVFASNATVVQTLGTGLSTSPDFLGKISELIYAILQGGTPLPAGTILLTVPDFSVTVPSVRTIRGPVITSKVPATAVTGTAATINGSEVTTTTTGPTTQTVTTESLVVEYDLLSPAVTGATDGGAVAELPSSPVAGAKYTLSADADARTSGPRRGRRFASGAVMTFANRHWYEVRVDGTTLYPVEMEHVVVPPVMVSEKMLYAGSRFALEFVLQARLEGNALGRGDAIIEAAPVSPTSGTIGSQSWTVLQATPVLLGPGTTFHSLGVSIERDADDELSGEVKNYGNATAISGGTLTTIASTFNFIVRVRFANFDIGDVTGDALGALTVEVRGARGSVVALEDV